MKEEIKLFWENFERLYNERKLENPDLSYTKVIGRNQKGIRDKSKIITLTTIFQIANNLNVHPKELFVNQKEKSD